MLCVIAFYSAKVCQLCPRVAAMARQWQPTEWTDDWTGWNENGWISGATQASAEQPATDGWTGWNGNGWISAATNASAEQPASHAQGRLDSAPTQSRIEQQREQQRQAVEERGAEQPALRLDDTQPMSAPPPCPSASMQQHHHSSSSSRSSSSRSSRSSSRNRNMLPFTHPEVVLNSLQLTCF